MIAFQSLSLALEITWRTKLRHRPLGTYTPVCVKRQQIINQLRGHMVMNSSDKKQGGSENGLVRDCKADEGWSFWAGKIFKQRSEGVGN